MSYDGFSVSLGRHLMSGFVQATRPLWRWLGGLESKVLADQLADVDISHPVYVAGLARSGSTVLLEIIASHPEIVTHQYRDFPFLYIPYWWQQTMDRQVRGQLEPAERAHKDRIQVTRESPEAMEEPLWMAFFDGLHDPSRCQVLDAHTDNPDFETFYRDHIRKLLAARDGSRYAAKGNYSLTRIEYLLKLFPDARFVIPVRRPRAHIASSMKQHELFCEGISEHPRGQAHLERVGHYEFGPHRSPIHTGHEEEHRRIRQAWEAGEEVRGWARYWAHLYGFVARRLRKRPELAEAAMVVRYEDLCDDTRPMVSALMEHCELGDAAEAMADRYETEISRPDYYEHGFSPEDEAIIDQETGPVARQFGYEAGEVVDPPEWVGR